MTGRPSIMDGGFLKSWWGNIRVASKGMPLKQYLTNKVEPIVLNFVLII